MKEESKDEKELELITRTFQENEIRIVNRGGAPWFVLPDLYQCLRSSDIRKISAQLEDNEKEIRVVDTPEGKKGLMVAPAWEIGMIISKSRNARAKEVTDWICEEILPKFREIEGKMRDPERMTFDFCGNRLAIKSRNLGRAMIGVVNYLLSKGILSLVR